MNGDSGQRGYRGHLVDACASLAEVLKPAGYRTYLSGKWHLGNPDPIARGFDESYTLIGGFRNFWDPQTFRRQPTKSPKREYAPGKFYATDAITDHASTSSPTPASRTAPISCTLHTTRSLSAACPQRRDCQI